MIPRRWWYRTISNDLAARLGEEDQEQHEHDGVKDGEEPEYRVPAKVLCEYSSKDRTQRWSESNSDRHEANVAASLGGCYTVGDDAAGDGDHARSTCALDAAEHHQGGVVVLQGKSDVGAQVYDEADHVSWAAAGAVGEAANECRG